MDEDKFKELAIVYILDQDFELEKSWFNSIVESLAKNTNYSKEEWLEFFKEALSRKVDMIFKNMSEA